MSTRILHHVITTLHISNKDKDESRLMTKSIQQCFQLYNRKREGQITKSEHITYNLDTETYNVQFESCCFHFHNENGLILTLALENGLLVCLCHQSLLQGIILYWFICWNFLDLEMAYATLYDVTIVYYVLILVIVDSGYWYLSVVQKTAFSTALIVSV